MTWAKFDDGFPDHEKIVGLSHPAFRLHVTAICYASRLETDGRVPKAAAFVQALRRHVDELLVAGVWEQTDNEHFVIHDFLAYNPSRSELLQRRQATAERVSLFRHNGRGNAASNAVTNSVGNPSPDPTRPVPSRDPVPTDPPNPPQAGGTTAERAERAKNGSGRQRDVVALRETETPQEAIERHRAKLFAHSGRTA